MNAGHRKTNSGSVAISAHDARKSRIVATVLCDNAEPLIEAAISSIIEWVDEICIIDAGVTDATIERAISMAGAKISCTSYRWNDDFAQARNFAVGVASQAGGKWALTVDTDERLEFHGYASQHQLLQQLETDPVVTSWMVWAQDGSYAKTRFIRLPTAGQWEGRTHESFVGHEDSKCQILPNSGFWEIPKTGEQFRRKLERDLIILLEETAAKPSNPRWWYYLGQTYEGLKMHESAIHAFDKCIRLDGWADESSWACYAAARCLVSMNRFRQAEEYCGLGMTRKPSVPELPWLAGWCCFKRGVWSDAITWSELAISLARDTADRRSAIFRHMPAWYEAPYDVLRHVYQRLGALDLAKQAESEFQARKAARLQAAPASFEEGERSRC